MQSSAAAGSADTDLSAWDLELLPELLAGPYEHRPNPLFINAPSGYGKTQLLHRIAFARTGQPTVVSVVDLFSSFVDAIRTGCVAAWKARHLGEDLLLDDLDDLHGNSGMQTELTRLIATLAQDGKLTVLASIRPISDYPILADELTRRCRDFAEVTLAPASPAVRSQAIKARADALGVDLSADVVAALECYGAGSLSELLGDATRCLFIAGQWGEQVSPALVADVLLPD